MNSKATERPWKLIDYGDGDIEITDLEQQFGACRVREESNENRAMMKANAELIVRAVNCHDELVAGIEYLLNSVEVLPFTVREGFEELLKRAKGEL